MKRQSIGARILLALITLLFLLLVCQCSGVDPGPRPQEFTFAVYSLDHPAEIDASVRWGVNSIEFSQRVKSGGFASAFMAYDKDLFFIQVDSADPLLLVIINNKTKRRVELTVDPGLVYKLETI
jgi:hypothetical protein